MLKARQGLPAGVISMQQTYNMFAISLPIPFVPSLHNKRLRKWRTVRTGPLEPLHSAQGLPVASLLHRNDVMLTSITTNLHATLSASQG